MIDSIKVAPRDTEVISWRPIDTRALLKAARKLKAWNMNREEARGYFSEQAIAYLVAYYMVEGASSRAFFRRHRRFCSWIGYAPDVPRLVRG